MLKNLNPRVVASNGNPSVRIIIAVNQLCISLLSAHFQRRGRVLLERREAAEAMSARRGHTGRFGVGETASLTLASLLFS